VFDTILRFFQRYGFFKREPVSLGPDESIWSEHGFYKQGTAGLAWERMNSPAALKAKRLAQIARERDALKERLAKAIRDKKARSPIYQALRALSVEELKVESGK